MQKSKKNSILLVSKIFMGMCIVGGSVLMHSEVTAAEPLNASEKEFIQSTVAQLSELMRQIISLKQSFIDKSNKQPVTVHLGRWAQALELLKDMISVLREKSNLVQAGVFKAIIAPLYALLEDCYTQMIKAYKIFEKHAQLPAGDRNNMLKLAAPLKQMRAEIRSPKFKSRFDQNYQDVTRALGTHKIQGSDELMGLVSEVTENKEDEGSLLECLRHRFKCK